MFEITQSEDGIISLVGRFDAAQVDKAKEIFEQVGQSSTVDFSQLDYISSAGLGVLLAAQKRLDESGHGLKLVNMNKLVRDVFRYSRLDTVFTIE